MAMARQWTFLQPVQLPISVLLLALILYLAIRYVQSQPRQKQSLPVAQVRNDDWKDAIHKASAQVRIDLSRA